MPEILLDAAKGNVLGVALPSLLPKLAKGDTIRLAGDHSVAPLNVNAPAPGYVTIIAGTGGRLGPTSFGPNARNWRVAWMPFRGLDQTPGNVDDITRLVDVAPGAEAIDFLNCNFAATDDVKAWTQADWVSKPHNVAVLHRGNNSTVRGGRFFNVRNALSIGGTGNTVDGVTIEDFGNDAMQIGGSRLKILNPIIRRGRHSSLEKLHADAIQFVLAALAVAQDILIQGAKIDMTGALGDYLQGITGFDGIMRRIKILDCEVKCNAPHGVAIYGGEDVEIARCKVSGTGSTPPWIAVYAAKDGRPSTGVNVHDCTATGGIKLFPTQKGP